MIYECTIKRNKVESNADVLPFDQAFARNDGQNLKINSPTPPHTLNLESVLNSGRKKEKLANP